MNRKSHPPECCPLLTHCGVPVFHTDYISRLRQCVCCSVFPENMLEDSSRSISLLSLLSVVSGSPTLPSELCLTCALLGHPGFLLHQPPQLGWLPQQGGPNQAVLLWKKNAFDSEKQAWLPISCGTFDFQIDHFLRFFLSCWNNHVSNYVRSMMDHVSDSGPLRSHRTPWPS